MKSALAVSLTSCSFGPFSNSASQTRPIVLVLGNNLQIPNMITNFRFVSFQKQLHTEYFQKDVF